MAYAPRQALPRKYSEHRGSSPGLGLRRYFRRNRVMHLRVTTQGLQSPRRFWSSANRTLSNATTSRGYSSNPRRRCSSRRRRACSRRRAASRPGFSMRECGWRRLVQVLQQTRPENCFRCPHGGTISRRMAQPRRLCLRASPTASGQ